MVEQHGKTLVPQIRFAGFTDPWEQRKLGELFEEHSEKDRDDLPALTIIQGGGTVHRDESKRNLQFDRSSLSNYKVVDTGDFIVHLRSFEGGLEKATCYGLVSPAYHIFRGKNVDSDFYYLYFRSKRFIDVDLKPHVYGIRDGRSIDIEGMKTIFIPWTNLAEQRQIGAFFDRLNSLITLHQRKYDKLCVLKKSMLDKMFPKGGSLYPEIRFAGFTDPWEQRKLGEFGSVAMCKRIYKEQTSEQGDVPFFKIGTFGANPDAFISNELFEDFKCIYPYPTPGTLLISAAGSIGRVVEYQGEKAYFQDSNIVWLEHDHRLNDAFLKPLYSRIEWGLEGSTIKRLYNKDLLSAEVTVPGSREQKGIGQFFAKLDNLITLHQRKLELLRNIKKSMLDKMFV